MAERFFATLECELRDQHRFQTPEAARRAVFEAIEGWYNPRRRHSAITAGIAPPPWLPAGASHHPRSSWTLTFGCLAK